MKTFHYVAIVLLLATNSLLWMSRKDLVVLDIAHRKDTVVLNTRSVAQNVVQRAYDETFAELQSCSRDEALIPCLQRLHNNATNTRPWWFQSLLRDASVCHYMHGIQGVCDGKDAWHNVIMNTPPEHVLMCLIDKIATKQWRQVWTRLSNTTAKLNTKEWDQVYLSENSRAALQNLPPSTPRVVFLRDPLERFLSAFLDKCIGRKKREGYCWPHSIYYPTTDELFNEENFHTQNLTLQQQFEQFVDVMPLQWNIHFAPLGLSCDGLYRHVKDYDFVGYMDNDFYTHLLDMGERYGPQMMQALNETFRLNRSGATTGGIETSAVSKVGQFYTPKTVRKVLEYVSLDYVALNQSIPAWAERMLQDGEKEEAQSTHR